MTQTQPRSPDAKSRRAVAALGHFRYQIGMEILAEGRCLVGVHSCPLELPSREPMAGFSWAGSWGRPAEEQLFARALYLEDLETGHQVVLCIVDLMSCSLRLLQEVEQKLASQAPELRGRVVVSGTHTHSAPGRFFGNSFYDFLAQPIALRGFRQELTSRLADGIVTASVEAYQSRSEGSLHVGRSVVWGAGGNRSLKAYQANLKDPELPPASEVPPDGLPPTHCAVEPRMTSLVAYREGKVLGLFAWHACHATALGPKWKSFSRDWPGQAVAVLERELGCPCAVGGSAAGDISPLPAEAYPELNGTGGSATPTRAARSADVSRFQGEQLARGVGETVARALLQGLASSPSQGLPALPISLQSGLFEVRSHGSVARWQMGVPALGGAEDGGPTIPFYELVAEGFRGYSGSQAPKAPALGLVQFLARGSLDIARQHPWYRLRLGEHLLCTVPGEATVTAGRVLEQTATRNLSAKSASIIGYAGDYAGYFTTEAEYNAQHYEGASTLYGPRSLEWLREQSQGAERPLPEMKQSPELRSGGIPQRHLEGLLKVAIELPEHAGRRGLLFATRSSQLPAARLNTAAGSLTGIVRREPNPDSEDPAQLSLYSAWFVDYPGSDAQLEVTTSATPAILAIREQASAEDNGALPSTVRPPVQVRWVRRCLLGLGLFYLAVCALALVFPERVLGWLGWHQTAFDVWMVRQLGLTPALVGINMLWGKNSRDVRALAGYAWSAATFSTILTVAAWLFGSSLTWVGGSAISAIAMGVLASRIGALRRGRPQPAAQHWEFWRPLFWVGALTLLGGVVLNLFPGVLVKCLGIGQPMAVEWLRIYGACFWVNTVAMWTCQATRDLRVVRGQLYASLFFDCFSICLLTWGLVQGFLGATGLLLLLPFCLIAVTFPAIDRRARKRGLWRIAKPRTPGELARMVRDTGRKRELFRVIGSGHSVPEAIYANKSPCPPAQRPTTEPYQHVSLKYLDQIVDVDRDNLRITVQAGMHLGEDPCVAESADNNLLLHLAELGWALNDLGGIVHQTVGGFLSTGSSGGSTQHSLCDNIYAIRFIDGQGQFHTVYRGAEGEEGAIFEAVSVSMGLLGVILEVTFQCHPHYYIQGREFTAKLEGSVAQLTPEGWRGKTADAGDPPPTRLDLSSDGEDGLEAYFRRVEYSRILWWPQQKVQSLVLWEGWRSSQVPDVAQPYEADASWSLWVGGKLLQLVGWSHGRGISRVIGAVLRKTLLPTLISFFLPQKPKLFNDAWSRNLPMDTNIDDALMPVEFTELWFPMHHAAEVMRVLLNMYQDPEVAGTFAVELYAARASDAWLSPAYQQDSFRVDIFWFQRNQGDPCQDYYPQFFEALAPYAFRPHWGKYLPLPGSDQGPGYLQERYPMWEAFVQQREAMDPDRVFLSNYWRRALDL